MRYQDYDITLSVTQRCNAKCIMCNSHTNPTAPEEEITIEDIMKMPDSKFIQITGGEPFIRSDIEKITEVLCQKAKRLMINTNGFYTERIVRLAQKYPQVAIRVSIDGRKKVHDTVRGISVYDRAMETLRLLKKMKVKDLGMSFTLQECNYQELLPLYHMAVDTGIDFGVSIVHNSFYFSKDDNKSDNKKCLENALCLLVKEQLESDRKKDWARAYYNEMSIRYIYGKTLPVHCDAGVTSFFISALGFVLPCNMTHEPWVMGDLKGQSWKEILETPQARQIIRKCKDCKIQCWSVCNMQSALKKKIWIPGKWLIRRKFLRKEYKE